MMSLPRCDGRPPHTPLDSVIGYNMKVLIEELHHVSLRTNKTIAETENKKMYCDEDSLL